MLSENHSRIIILVNIMLKITRVSSSMQLIKNNSQEQFVFNLFLNGFVSLLLSKLIEVLNLNLFIFFSLFLFWDLWFAYSKKFFSQKSFFIIIDYYWLLFKLNLKFKHDLYWFIWKSIINIYWSIPVLPIYDANYQFTLKNFFLI